MSNYTEKLEKLVLNGAANDVVMYYENYFTYLTIAEKSSAIARSNVGKFYTLAQMNALNAMHLHCCRMYEPKHRIFEKRTFVEVVELLRRHKSDIKIHNANACKKFITGEYDLANDYVLDGCEPTPDSELTVRFYEAMQKRLPEKEYNLVLWEKFQPIWKTRSKEIAHNDLQAVETRSTFEGLNELIENAVDIVNAISQVYFGVINMTPNLELSLVEDGKSSSVALRRILAE